MMRVGLGYDVHPLVAGRPCILGGVEVPYDKGLDGYSDGDVLLHALCDALLGAAGAGDLGRHFPSGDPKWKGISSLELLDEVVLILAQKGYKIINCDCVVIAEAPKIAPYVAGMIEKICTHLNIAAENVNVKGTTNDGLGFIGRGEGIAAQAVCLIASQHAPDD